MAGIGLTLCLFLSLTACDSTSDTPAPASNESTTSGATKAELTARARIVYEKYLDAVDQIAERDSQRFDALRPYLTDDAYRAEVDSITLLRKKGLRTTGTTTLVKFQTQNLGSGGETLTAYACVDLSDVKVLDASGKDVTPLTRPNRQTSLPSFEMQDGAFRLEKNGTWSGPSIC